MFKSLTDCNNFSSEFLNLLSVEDLDHKTAIIFPPFPFLQSLASSFRSTNNFFIGAQNCNEHNEGAFTGEVSTSMIKSTGADYVLVGHSERRQYFNEDSSLLLNKTKAALKNDLTVVYCCGEKLHERQAKDHFKVVEEQINSVFSQLEDEALDNIIIAYEPVWAIGTGETASPSQAQEMHAHIRDVIKNKFGKTRASKMSILYGGSVKPTNAAELFSEPDIDGGLVGGASLKPTDFLDIIKAMP